MKSILLPGTDLEVTRFIFGTASLFNVGVAKKRQEHLYAAVDAGFSHFDTAPYYGFGLAEKDLASVFKSHRHVTFTTKVGIYSPGGEAQSGARVFLRKAIGRLIKPMSRPTVDFSLDRARLSLEGSLRRTGRDVIDIYVLHEPSLSLVATEEWRRWLESCVAEGKVRYFGLALTADKLQPFLEKGIGFGQVIQVCDSLNKREADILGRHRRPMQITYGYVSAAFKEGSPVDVPEILKQSLRRNRDGAVIVSSKKTSRLWQYARLVEEATDDQ